MPHCKAPEPVNPPSFPESYSWTEALGGCSTEIRTAVNDLDLLAQAAKLFGAVGLAVQLKALAITLKHVAESIDRANVTAQGGGATPSTWDWKTFAKALKAVLVEYDLLDADINSILLCVHEGLKAAHEEDLALHDDAAAGHFYGGPEPVNPPSFPDEPHEDPRRTEYVVKLENLATAARVLQLAESEGNPTYNTGRAWGNLAEALDRLDPGVEFNIEAAAKASGVLP